MFQICFIIGITLIIIGVVYMYYQKVYDTKIDIVITWVKRDTEFTKEFEYWQNQYGISIQKTEIDKRYTDNQELKYVLRSIVKNFNKFNNIYLVVKDGQYPDYLVKEHPKLKIVNHSSIIPKECLPTFNSMVIEAYIHKIKGLSNNYLYLNDDMIFLRKLTKSYFLKNNLPLVLYINDEKKKYIDQHEIDLNNYNFKSGYAINNAILDSVAVYESEGRHKISHIPKMFNRLYDYEIENRLKKYKFNDSSINVYDETCLSKFRKNKNLYLSAILKEYLYHYWFDRDFKKTYLAYMGKFVKPKHELRSFFLCIQQVKDEDIDIYREYMNTLFPEKSSFEI